MERGSFDIPEEERSMLEEMHRACIDKRTADKIKTILLVAKGWSYEEIQEVLLLDKRTFKRYKQIYKKGGAEALVANNYQGGFYKLTEDQIEEPEKALDTNLFSSAKQICQYIIKEFNVSYTPEGMVKTLHRLGYSYKQTKPTPGKINIEKQKDFIERYKKINNSLSVKEKIFFSDGVHPTHNVIPGHAWIKTGTERHIKTNDGRKRLNLIGYYNSKDQDIVVKEYPTINSDAVIDSLKLLERKYSDLDKIYVILDNARYNHSKNVKEYIKTSKISLIWLPPYSSNLNFIERLWGVFKKKVLYNQYYESFADFKIACLKFFNKRSRSFKEHLRSVISEKFHLLPKPMR